MTLGDTHVHSSFSGDSSTPMEENVLRAIDKGLPYLCMTDHIDWDYPVDDAIFDFSPDQYFVTINALRKKYDGRIRLLAGVELGMQTHLGNRYRKLIKAYPFDFVIGSQHLVRGSDPYNPWTFDGYHDRDIYHAYFEETLQNIRLFHDFDSLGHLDYIVRYGKEKRSYRYSDYADVLDDLLKALVRYNLALEVNTAGIRKHLGAPNPQPDVLKRYRELGGTLVTIGSDSHKSYSLGYAFEETKAILKRTGFTHVVYYEERRPRFVRL